MIGKIAPALLFALAAWPLVSATPDFRLQKIGNGVWAAIVNDEGLAGGNAGFVIGEGSGNRYFSRSPARESLASRLLAEIRKLRPLLIRLWSTRTIIWTT